MEDLERLTKYIPIVHFIGEILGKELRGCVA